MRARVAAGVRPRPEAFGGVVYVGARDDFFALDGPRYQFFLTFSREWRDVAPTEIEATSRIASLGLLETVSPVTPLSVYSNPHFLGAFEEIPAIENPLVVNYFATANCMLRCTYCHADDLMQRPVQRAEDREPADALELLLKNIRSTSTHLGHLSSVVTGGDPLSRPGRARAFIEALSPLSAIVLDTSAAVKPSVMEGQIELLLRHQAHVRVSLDDADPRRNARTRVAPERAGEFWHSIVTQNIRLLLSAGVPLTVQTVVTGYNSRADRLRDLRDWLIQLGVKNWVLHVVVQAGRNADVQIGNLRRDATHIQIVSKLLENTRTEARPIDVRVTDTDGTPNSVLLVDSLGALRTEGLAHRGKLTLFNPALGHADSVRREFHLWDRSGHARRYLNWSQHLFRATTLADLCFPVPVPATPREREIVERERKFRVTDIEAFWKVLDRLGLSPASKEKYVEDQYFDDEKRSQSLTDSVVRMRRNGGAHLFAVKGPRFRSIEGEYSRTEIEVPTNSKAVPALTSRGLVSTWTFGRTRRVFRNSTLRCDIDVFPEGFTALLPQTPGIYAEFEAPSSETLREVAAALKGCAEPETGNYKEILVRALRELGHPNGRGVTRAGVLDEKGKLVPFARIRPPRRVSSR